MAEDKLNSTRLALIYGVAITAMLIAYFLVAVWLDFVHNYYFRAFNFIFMLLGIISVIKRLKDRYRSHFSFWKSFMLGLLTSFVAVGFFSIFMFLYFEIFDPAFLQMVKEQEALGQYLYPATVILTIFAEGLGSGLIITLGTTLFLKDRRTTEDNRLENKGNNI